MARPSAHLALGTLLDRRVAFCSRILQCYHRRHIDMLPKQHMRLAGTSLDHCDAWLGTLRTRLDPRPAHLPLAPPRQLSEMRHEHRSEYGG